MSGIVGSSSSGILIRAIPNYLASLTIKFTHSTAVQVQNAKFRIYDRSNIDNGASGVTTRVCELRHPDIIQNNNGSGSIFWESLAGSSTIMSLCQSPGLSGVHATGTSTVSSSEHHMLALHSAGVDVVSRTVKINDSNGQVPDLVKSFECKRTDNVDAIIQHVLPHYYETTSVCKNIGMYLNDMDTLNFANWGRKLSLMDEIWCPNNKTKEAITKYNSKVEVVPHPCDISIYDKEYKKMDFGPHNGNFIFYFIGELNSRKNIKDLIRAFHTEFSPSEPVSLLLKVNKSGISTDQMMNILVSTS